MSVLHRPTLFERFDLTKNLFTYAFGFGQRFTMGEQQLYNCLYFITITGCIQTGTSTTSPLELRMG